MKVYIKNLCRKKNEFQFFMHQFVEACIVQGIPSVDEWSFLKVIKLSGLLTRIARLIDLFRIRNKYKAIIVCTSGGGLIYNSFPYNLFYEIIPVFWDSWPFNWEEQIYSLKRLRCRVCFVTSSQVAQKIRLEFPDMKVYWIPEGIDLSDYHKGVDLSFRNIELYELGRQKVEYHQILCDLRREKLISDFSCNEYDANGMTTKLAYPTAEALLKALPNIKIVVSFPQIDTHPEKVGAIETLTQRYWEAMLSRNLIIGRAPNELIELIGYNPVVDVDWNDPKQQLIDVISNIEMYQTLVDKNYSTATNISSWGKRVEDVKDILTSCGYSI